MKDFFLTFNCRFMTQNTLMQSPNPTTFIGNYAYKQCTHNNNLHFGMYLLLLLYAARHITVSTQSPCPLPFNFLLLTRF